MDARGAKFQEAFVSDELLHSVGAFVVKDVFFYLSPCSLDSLEQLLICRYHLVVRFVFHWVDKYVIAVDRFPP